MILRRIDDCLFDRIFQPLVDRFPDAGPTGVARFFLAGCIVAAAFDDTIKRSLVGFAICLPFWLWWYVTADWSAQRAGCRNPRRMSDIASRLLLLTLVTLCSVICHDIGTVSVALFVAYSYSIACDRLPPKPRRAPLWTRLFGRVTA